MRYLTSREYEAAVFRRGYGANARSGQGARPIFRFTTAAGVADNSSSQPHQSKLERLYRRLNEAWMASVAHPGGNITGFANVEPSAFGKMIALLKEIVPHNRTIVFIYSNRYVSGNFTRDWIISRQATDAAAKAHSIELIDIPAENEQEIEHAFEKLGADPTAAVVLLADGCFVGQRLCSPVPSSGDLSILGICVGRRPDVV